MNGQVRSEDLLTPARSREKRPVLKARQAIVVGSGKLPADIGDGLAAVITSWTFDVVTIRRGEEQTQRVPVVTAISPDGRSIAVCWNGAADRLGPADPAFSISHVLSGSAEILVADQQTEPGQIHLLARTWQLISRGRHVQLRFTNPRQRQAKTTQLEDHEIVAAVRMMQAPCFALSTLIGGVACGKSGKASRPPIRCW